MPKLKAKTELGELEKKRKKASIAGPSYQGKREWEETRKVKGAGPARIVL